MWIAELIHQFWDFTLVWVSVECGVAPWRRRDKQGETWPLTLHHVTVHQHTLRLNLSYVLQYTAPWYKQAYRLR